MITDEIIDAGDKVFVAMHYRGRGRMSRLSTDFTNFVSKTLPAGSWAVTATANISYGQALPGDPTEETVCELRNGSGFIGGATNARVIDRPGLKSTLSMNGGAQVPVGGGAVSLYCKKDPSGSAVTHAQIMFIRLDGFS